MRIRDILRGVLKVLNSKYPNVQKYGEQVQQGIELPCFFVYLVPLTTANGLYLSSETISVKIVYLQKEKDIEELYDVRDELKRLFALSFRVRDTDSSMERSLTVPNTETQIIEGDLHFSFAVKFFESMTLEEDYELIGHLTLEME